MKKALFIIAMLGCAMQNQAQITDTGTNVGIGTTTPASKLHIQSSNATETHNTYFSGNNLHFDRSGNGSSYIDKTDAGDLILRFGLPVVNRFIFTNEGKLGIGTTVPRAKLDLGGNVGANNGFRVGDYIEINERETINNAGVIGFNASIDTNDVSKFKPTWSGTSTSSGMVLSMESGGGGTLDFYGYNWGTDATPRSLSEFTHIMRIGTNGKVGIGTLNPSQKLHVNDGNVLITPENNNASGVFKINEYRGGSLLDFSEVGDAGLLKVGYYGLTGDRVEINGGISNTGAEIKGYDDASLKFHLKSNGVSFFNGGNIGVGTTSPESNLQVGSSTMEGLIMLGGGKGYSSIGSTRSDGGLILGKNIYARYLDATDNLVGRVGKSSTYGYTGIKIGQNGVIDFFGKEGNVTADAVANTNETSRMHINSKGNVGIGTKTTGTHRLAVEGTIGAREIKVETTAWPDYVFEKEYTLPTLLQVETHIKEKGHLPNIPSAEEVAKDGGIELGKMNKKLLEKIEELTLYTIQQQKQLKKLSEEIDKLKKMAEKE